MAGLYIAERTERDGVLVAYEGEAMSEAEAKRRGLIVDEPGEAPKPAPKRTRGKTAKGA